MVNRRKQEAENLYLSASNTGRMNIQKMLISKYHFHSHGDLQPTVAPRSPRSPRGSLTRKDKKDKDKKKERKGKGKELKKTASMEEEIVEEENRSQGDGTKTTTKEKKKVKKKHEHKEKEKEEHLKDEFRHTDSKSHESIQDTTDAKKEFEEKKRKYKQTIKKNENT